LLLLNLLNGVLGRDTYAPRQKTHDAEGYAENPGERSAEHSILPKTQQTVDLTDESSELLVIS
jgi:hypothetical protein